MANIKYLFILALTLCFIELSGQIPDNDECSGAFVIDHPFNYCTPEPFLDFGFASPSPQPGPSCNVWVPQRDLWFSFTAVAADVAIVTTALDVPLVLMVGQQTSLYTGTCDNLTELDCASTQPTKNSLLLYAHNLVVGQQYYIRFGAASGFLYQLCIRNEDKSTLNEVSGDCPTANIICNKSPIVVNQVFGPGNTLNDFTNAPCIGNNSSELSSAWYVFTAANAGSLEFTITPNNLKDDIDFVLYRLPNGPGDCSDKIWERCMQAGGLDSLSPCMGPTGLNATALDISQPAGCIAGMDNFLKFISLIPGATYALGINNHTSYGAGFTLEWGGDAIFQGGTTANFTTDEPDKIICLGEEIEVTDSSYTLNGMLAHWNWDFGSGAITDTTLGQGPHVVQYQTLGPKQIILRATNTEGCIGLDTAFLFVEQCCSLEAAVSTLSGCPYNPPTPAIATVDVHNTLAAVQITWSNGQSGNIANIDDSGTYTVYVEDENGCVDSVEFLVNTPLNISTAFPIDTTTEFGKNITLSVNAMPNQSLSVWWINPENDTLLGPVQTLALSETTTYVIVVNNSGCVFTDTLTVEIKPPTYERPNAFSPNGDGSNDTFGPVLIGHSLLQMEIWTRWGEKVFDSLVQGRDVWDGTIQGVPAASDVYVYRMRVGLIDGQERVDNGEVTLLR